MKSFLFFATLGIVLISCDKNRVSEYNVDQPNAIWLADSIAKFDFKIDNLDESYNILLNVRNGRQFPHSNIYVKYFLIDDQNNQIESELRKFDLFHPKTGYPLGDGARDIFESQFLLLKNYSFADTGTYLMNVQQYMRYDSLPEIYSVGIRVERSLK